MTRVLVWKEIREQWLVCLALTLAAMAATASSIALLSPGRNRDETLVVVLYLAALGYGLICGAQLLAGEVEEGTQNFLDALPATRRRLWRVKALTGLLFLALQVAALMGVGFVSARQGYLATPSLAVVAGLLYCGCVGYAWGLFCGSFSANVLGAIGWAVLLLTLSAFMLFPLVVLPIGAFRSSTEGDPMVWIAAAGVLAAGVATRSRAVYCQFDRLRERALPRRP